MIHIDVIPVAKKELTVIEVVTIEDDEENEDCKDISPDGINEDDGGEESNVSSNDSSLFSHSPKVRLNRPLSNDQVIEELLRFEIEDNLVSVSSDGATSSLGDKTSDKNTNLSTQH